MSLELLRAHFREQAELSRIAGSPFTADLITRMGSDLDAGGPVADLVASWPGHPRSDAVAIRLCGALHAATLTGLDQALAAEYPAQRSDWTMDAVWARARALLRRERAWVQQFIRSPPQTNEVRRAAALLPGFLSIARDCGRTLDLLELGASAGLSLNWERFAYRTATWTWGPSDGLLIECDWSGPPPPLDVTPVIRSRAACDLNPCDLRDDAQRTRLRAYIWADQQDRLARFDAAAAVALASGVQVARADAAKWLPEQLVQRAPDAVTVVYHSVFLQYLTREARRSIHAAIETAGERATTEAPLAWLRLEPESMLGGPADSHRLLVEMITWPGASRRVLAVTDGHARAITCNA